MPVDPKSLQTPFSHDILGRFICNTLQEAKDSADPTARRPDGSPQPDARPFSVIVIGGGTFGAVFAQHLFAADKTHQHRILVLEGGGTALPEHAQNLPTLGLNPPDPSSIADLRASNAFGPDKPRSEVWGLPWHSATRFPGLAYAIGGRSLFWGGWSPRPLDTTADSELARSVWPADVVNDLNSRYYAEAADQLGVADKNDFIHGELHDALRMALFQAVNAAAVEGAIPLAELPDSPTLTPESATMAPVPALAAGGLEVAMFASSSPAPAAPSRGRLQDLLGLPTKNQLPRPGTEAAPVPPTPAELVNLLKLEAPLAVQSVTRTGFFPSNKFSAVPVLMKAARLASSESLLDDVRKRLMVVPWCNVNRIATSGGRPVAIETNQGTIDARGAAIVVALGTVESARLVLNSFPGIAGAGRGLVAHLRSNLQIRVPREALADLLDPSVKQLQASALFLKGKHVYSDDGQTAGYFHLQITAAGLDAVGGDSEAELFKKVPDLDQFNVLKGATDTHIVVTIRAIGEMDSRNPQSRIELDPEVDEFGAQRAKVTISTTARDQELWTAMDKASDDVARAFARGQPFEVFTPAGAVKADSTTDLQQVLPYKPGRRDGLGTTHHEAGTLQMNADPARAVTDSLGQLAQAPGVYALGPSLQPTLGSPNPMLTGVALARRLADRLAARAAPAAEAGFTYLFDGTESSFKRWRAFGSSAGPGTFALADAGIVAYPRGDHTILVYDAEAFGDFVLRLKVRLESAFDNSGVFLRFRTPRSQWPDLAGKPHLDVNPAWVAVYTGFEVQIDEQAGPDGLDKHRTGAIYDVPTGQNGEPALQRFTRLNPGLTPGAWNDCEIEVRGDTFTVRWNGRETTSFTNTDAARGLAPSSNRASGYLGLQAHTGHVAFREIRIQKL